MSNHRSYYFQPPWDAGGGVVGAHIHLPELWPLVDSFYNAYRCEPGPEHHLVCQIVLWSESGTFWLRGPSGDWFADSPGEALAFFEAELTDVLLARTGTWIGLHGSAVLSSDGAIALLGPSGAGKSTLSLGLCEFHNLALLTDDALLLDAATHAAQRFERSLRVHRAGLSGLGLDPADLTGAQVVEPYCWIRPDAYGGDGREPAELVAVVFLDPGDGGDAELERLGPAESLRRLLVARLSDDADPGEELDTLAELSRTVPAFRLRVVDVRRCVDGLHRLAVVGGREPSQSGAGTP